MIEREKEILIKFGQNIKEFRKKRNMTIDELSEKTNINKRYLQKIEKGMAYGLKTSHIFIFANAFNIKPHKVVKGI